MFRIRQITDATLPVDQRELGEVQDILRTRFPGIAAGDVDTLPERLRNPLASQLRAVLLVTDDLRGRLQGFALMSHAPDLNFWILDFIATGKTMSGNGVGGALYQRVRETAAKTEPIGLFFECLPDDAAACSDPAYVKDNVARLRFYERFGAYPIIGTAYETPITPGDLDLPHLVFDDLGTGRPLSRADLRQVVEAFLRRKYAHLCDENYIRLVVDSIVDDPVRLRPPRHVKQGEAPPSPPVPLEDRIVLIVNDRHEIHHVRERGYVESPVRIAAIRKGLMDTGLFHAMDPRPFPEQHVLAVHDKDFVNYLRETCKKVEPGKSVYPYVFPVRNATRPPRDRTYAAGYYCIDTFTPLNQNAWLAARRAADCALTAASVILDGQDFAYALVRPPGHHAERRVFGGFCYLCNGAIAAQFLSEHGRVAILDVDYHHGNGQQNIFWERDDVLTVSIHGHPRFAYPFFTGFEEERGAGFGEGFNLNIPLPEAVDGARYLDALTTALRRIRRFRPDFLVVSLGLDTAKGDPTGTWTLAAKDFRNNGNAIAREGYATLVIQEGGYRTASLTGNARAFFQGLHEGRFRQVARK
ncbi:MAG: histone deacetylase family protein [Planctomycetes bacterium]|nr:histone deacetylase family protein [Planctomycetota bacterium]